MITPSKELKRRARGVLTGKYLMVCTLCAEVFLAYAGFMYLLDFSGFENSAKTMHQLFYWILWFFMIILVTLFDVGLIKFIYTLSRREPLQRPSIIFYAFKNQPDTFILTSGFRCLIALVWFVPALVVFRRLPFDTMEWADLVPSMLPVAGLALAGILPAVIAALPFALTNYILLDNPYISATEALMASMQLTKGRRMQIFRLWFSFLPMLLMTIGSSGIAFLWTQPYFHATICQYYLELTGQLPPPPAEKEPSFGQTYVNPETEETEVEETATEEVETSSETEA